jgi:hypothetical protein
MVVYSRFLYQSKFFLVPYAVLIVLLALSNYAYYYLLKNCEESPKTYHVVGVDDVSVYYINNILMNYVLFLLPVLLLPSVIGLVVFFALLLFLFMVYRGNDSLFFNPFLFMMGYRVYKVRTEEGNKVIRVLYKEKIQEGDYVRVCNFYEDIYLDGKL